MAKIGKVTQRKPSALMAHGRTIAALKATIGPDFNLSDLWEQHVYHWDQASVLVQIGLLDPALLPVARKRVGPQAARRVHSVEPDGGALEQ
jgi:hypothetical protein